MPVDSIVQTLLKNRGLNTKSEISGFLHPALPDKISLKEVGLDPKAVKSAIQLIKQHQKDNNKIFIYGDYDVDGICSTAILWETLHADYKHVFPHIPHRATEGYGLSQIGIDQCLKEGAKLIITVDNGIVSHSQIEYSRSQDCDVIVIDHHEPEDKFPPANFILHSVNTCAAGLTWFFCRELIKKSPSELLSLVSLAVICDLVPLIGINRSLAKYGLEELNQTKRPGLLALFNLSGLKKLNDQMTNDQMIKFAIGSYEVGYIIGPRLNAMGRLENAIDSLRLLCTTDPDRAQTLAFTLTETNRTRQDLTESAFQLALQQITGREKEHILIVSDPSFDPGVIGLIASKLTEKFYRPAIAISVGDENSKASARSVRGFHITEHIRGASALLESVGGHSMAAGFSLKTPQLDAVIAALSKIELSEDLLTRTRRIDCDLAISDINNELYSALDQFQPFGLGNPQPVFQTKKSKIENIRTIGKLNQHLKFTVGNLEAVYFNVPKSYRLTTNDFYDLTYSLSLNSYAGRSSLQLLIKDISPSP